MQSWRRCCSRPAATISRVRLCPVSRPLARQEPRFSRSLMPFEEPEKMRVRLAEDLRPANGLRIAFIGDGLEITRDSEPTRQFLPAQSVSRIDTSGAFNVSCGWDQGAFVIRAKYTNHGARSWKIEHDLATDSLRVTFTANNPQYGHLELHTLYRRTTEGAS